MAVTVEPLDELTPVAGQMPGGLAAQEVTQGKASSPDGAAVPPPVIAPEPEMD